MRRAKARGRMLPQSLSTDARYGRLSLKAKTLYPLIWINCDDQGRHSGDPDEVKYADCPSVKEIVPEDIPALLQEMDRVGLISFYSTSTQEVVQMLDWWEEQRLQWAWPSRYPPPEGWKDRLRFKPNPKEIQTQNWVPPSQSGGESPSAPPDLPPGRQAFSPLTTPSEKEKEEEEGRGRGNKPSAPRGALGSPPPSPAALSTDEIDILHELTACFKKEFGRVPAESPQEIIPREPTARESAQLRDFAKELSTRGGVPLGYIKEACRESAAAGKFHISYVRAVLLDWLGLGRSPP